MWKLKKELGENCTYVSHIRYKDNYGIVAKFRKEKPIEALLNGSPDDIKLEYYDELIKNMKDEAKERGLL